MVFFERVIKHVQNERNVKKDSTYLLIIFYPKVTFININVLGSISVKMRDAQYSMRVKTLRQIKIEDREVKSPKLCLVTILPSKLKLLKKKKILLKC